MNDKKEGIPRDIFDREQNFKGYRLVENGQIYGCQLLLRQHPTTKKRNLTAIFDLQKYEKNIDEILLHNDYEVKSIETDYEEKDSMVQNNLLGKVKQKIRNLSWLTRIKIELESVDKQER